MDRYDIPGYEFVGSVDISIAKADQEGVVLFLIDSDGDLGVLWAQGCVCCGTMNDDLVPDQVCTVINLEETAREIHEAVVASDAKDIPALRAMIIEAQKRMDWTRTVKAVQA